MQEPYSLYENLKQVARLGPGRGIIFYSDIAPKLGLDMDKQEDRVEIGRLLGEISTYEVSQGRPMLSAIVLLKSEMRPAQGFFRLARELGLHRGQDDETFFVQELRRIHTYWKTH